VNIDPNTLFNALLLALILGLGKWVWSLNAKVATFVTREQLGEFHREMNSNFSAVHSELRKLLEDLAYLKGKQGN